MGCSQAEPPPQKIIIEIEGDSELLKKAVADSIEEAKRKEDLANDPAAQRLERFFWLKLKRDNGVATEEELAELAVMDQENARRRAELNLRLGRPGRDEEEAKLMEQIERELDAKTP